MTENKQSISRPLLNLQDVSKHFDGFEILSGVSFDLADRSCTGIAGDNGSGKSVLLNLIAGADRPSGGEITLSPNGGQPVNITKWPSWKRAQAGIMHLFQAPRIWQNLTVEEHILLALFDGRDDVELKGNLSWLLKAKTRASAMERQDELLELIELAGKKHDLASHLSYGQARLLNLGQIMAYPVKKLILLDEPLAGINQAFKKKILSLIGLFKQQDCAVVIVEHDTAMLREITDRMFLVKNGKVREKAI